MDFHKELVVEFEKELASTRSLLEAVPADANWDYKPHEKSMALGRLAGHVSDTATEWATCTLTMSVLNWPGGEQYVVKDKAAMLAKFDADAEKAKAALAAFNPADWDGNWKFVAGEQTWIDDTKYRVWRTWVINHLIHHRAQLGVYLRLMGAKIPGMYGPSADQMPS